MNIHPNARTCPRSRALLVRRVLNEQWTVEEAAQAAGISVRTGFKWLARFRAEGIAGLDDRSSRPARMPSQTPQDHRELVVRLRSYRKTARQIAGEIGMARSTVSRILSREGLSKLSRLEPPEPARRYERERPGDLFHFDIKRLGRIKRIGRRFTGPHRRSGVRAGYEYVHVCVDDYSRVAYVEVLESQTAVAAVGFLRRALAWFRELGVTCRRVMTDNGSCYKAIVFWRACASLGVRQIKTKPYRPQTNGKAERFIQTLLREWAYFRPYPNSKYRTAALSPWLRRYNNQRPHASLGGKSPISRIQDDGEQPP